MPEFWERLADLAAAWTDALDAGQQLGQEASEVLRRAQRLELFGQIALKAAESHADQEAWQIFETEMWERMPVSASGVAGLVAISKQWLEALPRDRDLRARLRVLAEVLRTAAGGGRSTRRAKPPLHFMGCLEESMPPTSRLWVDLERLARQCAVLSHRQLRGLPQRPQDRQLLAEFGGRLAQLHLYLSMTSPVPREDAPCIFVAATDYQGGVSHRCVATGYPRPLYVLHPGTGGPFLCRGAIVPYHEFMSDELLTDAQWRKQLREGEPAPQRPWLEEIYCPQKQ